MCFNRSTTLGCTLCFKLNKEVPLTTTNYNYYKLLTVSKRFSQSRLTLSSCVFIEKLISPILSKGPLQQKEISLTLFIIIVTDYYYLLKSKLKSRWGVFNLSKSIKFTPKYCYFLDENNLAWSFYCNVFQLCQLCLT